MLFSAASRPLHTGMTRAAHACLTAWSTSSMFDALGEHRLDGLLLPLAEQPLEPAVLPHRLNEPLRFCPGQLAVDESALLEATPFIVGPMARGSAALGDDQLGRALDHLFAADRGTLLTAVVVAAVRQFGVALAELHNDSTSVSFTGQYRAAHGRSLRGKRAPAITYGHSKQHRPDLKQLLFILTTSADGGVPVQFRCADGNTTDDTTHIETWETLCQLAGRRDFLYVADSKLCTGEQMDYIHRRQGRFVTVLPRSRYEDAEFREWILTHTPEWEEVWNRPHPRRRDGPRDIWRVFRYHLPSREVWPVIWVWSTLLAQPQDQARRERLARIGQELDDVQRTLAGPRPRRPSPSASACPARAVGWSSAGRSARGPSSNTT